MPVSKCAECGGDISSHAKKCPHCQAPKAKAFPQLTECAECGKEFNLLTEKECPGCAAPKKMAAPQYDGNSEMVEKAAAFGQAHRGKIKLTLVAILLTLAVIYLYPASKPGAKSPTEFGERLFESISKNDFKLFSSLWIEGWSDEVIFEVMMSGRRQLISYKEYKEKGLAEASPQQAMKFFHDEDENKKDPDFRAELQYFRAELQSGLKKRYEGLLNSLKEIGFEPEKAVLKEVDVSNVWKDHKGDYVVGAYSPIGIRISINREDYIIMFVLVNSYKYGWYPAPLSSLGHLREEYGYRSGDNGYWTIRKVNDSTSQSDQPKSKEMLPDTKAPKLEKSFSNPDK